MPLRSTTFSNITPRQIRVIGVPLDLGQSRRGVDMGPSAVRVAGLEARLEGIGHIVEDAGNVTVDTAAAQSGAEAKSKYIKEITATSKTSADLVMKTLGVGKLRELTGDRDGVREHTVSGVAKFFRRK